MATLYRHGTKPPVFLVSIVPPRVTYIDMPSIGPSIEALEAIPAGYPERQETPWNANQPANLPLGFSSSPRFGHLSRFGTSKAGVTSRPRHAASRGVTHGLGSEQALPWSCLVPIHSVLTEPSLRISSGFCFDNPSETHWVMAGLSRARIVHGSLHHWEDQ